MTIDYSKDDHQMYGMYTEGLEHLNTKTSTGMDQFTPKLQRRGNPNTRLSYASYFEEEETMFEPGESAMYEETGEIVNVVYVNEKNKTATIEQQDETVVYNVPISQLTHSI